MQPLSKPRVLPKVIERYFETLDFVWELREGVVYAPDWTLEDLADHESRAAAQLDGLLLAGDHGARLVLPALAGEEVFAATAATFVLMGSGLPEHADAVLKALESSGEEAREGIRIGLRHSAIEPAVARLTELAESGQSALRAAAADVLAFHRRALPDLQPLLEDEDELVRARMHCAYGRLWWIREAAVTERALEGDSAPVRRSALEAAARSALPGLAEI
jgi:HEAT repeat protein